MSQDPAYFAQALDRAGIGVWDWDIPTGGYAVSAAWMRQLGLEGTGFAVTRDSLRDRLHPDDLEATTSAVARAIEGTDDHFEREFRLRHADGSYRWVLSQASVLRDEHGAPLRMTGIHRDITPRKQAEAIVHCQAETLVRIADDLPLSDVLDKMLLTCEAEAPGVVASILLLDPDGKRLRHCSGPSLPVAYQQAIDGEAIGPNAGSCGTSAFRREAVVVTDIATDPLWKDYAPVALQHDLHACWSTPFLDSTGRVLGTFAMYYREPRAPHPDEFRLVEMATSLAVIAVTRHERRNALERSEHRFRRLVESDTVGVLVARTDGTIREANDHFLRMVGRSRRDVDAGTFRWDTMTPPEWADADAQIIADLGRHGFSAPVEKEYFHADGRRVPVLVAVSLLGGIGDDAICIIVDLSAQKRAEAERLDILERYRALVEGSADVFVTFDADGRLSFASPAIRSVLGREPHAVIGMARSELIHPDDHAATSRKAGEPERGRRREFRLRHADGSWREIAAYAIGPVAGPESGALVEVWHDVTDRNRAERAMRESADELRRLTQRLREVRDTEQARLSRELHDRLGQSLTMLKLETARLASMLKPGATGAASLAQKMMDDVDAAIQETRALATDLRPPLLDDLGLGAALEWAADRFTARTGIACTVECAEDDVAPEAARALYAIAQEALTNVTRHAGAAAVTVAFRRDGAHAVLEVSDSGQGFDVARAARPDALGIIGMRERAIAVGGTLVVRSKPGQGTTIIARAPWDDPSGAQP